MPLLSQPQEQIVADRRKVSREIKQKREEENMFTLHAQILLKAIDY